MTDNIEVLRGLEQAVKAAAKRLRLPGHDGLAAGPACADELEARFAALAAMGGDPAEAKPRVYVGTIGHVDRGKHTLTAALTRLGAPQQPEAQGEAVAKDFAAWLETEMPAGTIIGNPGWWANRIARQFEALHAARIALAKARQPEARVGGEVAGGVDAVNVLRGCVDAISREETDAGKMIGYRAANALIERFRAAIASRQPTPPAQQPAPVVPEGMVLVPVELSEEMRWACQSVVDLEIGDPEDPRHDDGRKMQDEMWAAMLAAAQQPGATK